MCKCYYFQCTAVYCVDFQCTGLNQTVSCLTTARSGYFSKNHLAPKGNFPRPSWVATSHALYNIRLFSERDKMGRLRHAICVFVIVVYFFLNQVLTLCKCGERMCYLSKLSCRWNDRFCWRVKKNCYGSLALGRQKVQDGVRKVINSPL